MANEIHNADKLLGRILQDARADADASVAEARLKADEIIEGAKHEAEVTAREAAHKAETVRTEALEHSRLASQLDARKYSLSERRKLIEEAFTLAHARINKLAGAERAGFFKTLLLRESEGGETIVPAKADESVIALILNEVNAVIAKDGKAPLTLGQGNEAIKGGFILRARDYEKDCSIAAVLKDSRNGLESAVAKILFEG